MKKWMLYIIIGILLLISISSIILLVSKNNNTSNIQVDTLDKFANVQENIIENNAEIVTTSYSSIKISPNANMVFQTYYKACNHTIEKKEQAKSDIVNLNEFELAQNYSDWDIKKFSSDEIILYKEQEGVCKEDYIIKEKDGNIVIFTLNDEGIEELYKTTNIQSQYLPEEDLVRIKNWN